MGIVPPSIAPWIRKQRETKDERPPLQGYGDQLEGYSGEEMDPPQGGSVIVRAPRSNPSIITEYGKPPRPRVDLDLIGDYYQ